MCIRCVSTSLIKHNKISGQLNNLNHSVRIDTLPILSWAKTEKIECKNFLRDFLFLCIFSCRKAHKALTFSFHPLRFAAKALTVVYDCHKLLVLRLSATKSFNRDLNDFRFCNKLYFYRSRLLAPANPNL